MNIDRLREVLDVCRDLRDLEAPELQVAADAVRTDRAARDYLEASLRFDRVVTKRLQQEEPPEGFQERLLESLASAVTTSDVTTSPVRLFGRTRRSRLLWVAATGLAATALVLLTFSGQFFGVLDRGELITMAQTWPRHDDLGPWRSDWDNTPARYPMARGLHAAPAGWQKCPTRFDPDTVVYQLVTSRGRQQGLLFVARGAVHGLSVAPQTAPESTTGNRCLGAWQANRCVYVLVVDGTASDFCRFVDVPLARRVPAGSGWRVAGSG